MKNSPSNFLATPAIGRLRCFYVLIIVLCFKQTFSQVCPVLTGGHDAFYLSSVIHTYKYPGLVPAGAAPESSGAATTGHIFFENLNISASDKSITTISPTLDGVNFGKVIFNIFSLNFGANTSLKIYKGSDETGALIDEITTANYTTKLGNEYVIDGNATLVFYGNTNSPGSHNIIRFLTGDMLIQTCNNGRSGLVWKDYIQPNSYVVIDDLEDQNNNTSISNYNFLSLCIAHFDADKNFVRTESAFCLNHDLDAPSPGYYYYPGEANYSLSSSTNYDIDNSGTFDAAVDNLKIARIIWLIEQANLPATSRVDKGNIQLAVWATQEQSVTYAFTAGSWEKQAQDAVPTIPSPAEPDFAMNLTTGQTGTATAGSGTIKVDIPFSWSAVQPGQTNVVTLDLPANVSVTGVTGATLSGSELTITATVATLTLSSSVAADYTLRAIYASAGYYNISNLQVYKACGSDFQNFLHLGEENLANPFRQISVTWVTDPLPVKLVSFDLKTENTNVNLYWHTADAVNFSHFEIEKSPNAKNWILLAVVPDNYSGQYNYVDIQNLNPLVYYRLKMVDLDGSYVYSSVKSIRLEQSDLLVSLYPNPVSTTLRISNLDIEKVKNFNVLDQSGINRMTYRGLKTNEIPVQSLSIGTYFVKIEMINGEKFVKKFIINR